MDHDSHGATRLGATRLGATALFVGVVLVLLGGCNCLEDLCEKKDRAKDELARQQYYEEAAKTYYDGGNYEQAVAMWDKVILNRPGDQWAKFGLGKSLQMVGTLQTLRRAQRVLEPIQNLDWTHPTRGNIAFEVQTTLAIVYSELSDFYDRDIRQLEIRLTHDEKADATMLKQQIARQKTMRNQFLTSSIPVWQTVLSQSPENPSALAGLAKANLVAGSETAGIHYADRYIKLSRESQEGWKRLLADWKKMMKGDVKPEQVNFYRKKIRGAREKEMGMLLLIGAVHMRREEFPQAAQRYDEILELDPARVAALVERAQAYAGMGQYARAVDDLEQYLKLTDARTQRESRISAADLLDRYKGIAARRPVNAGSATRRARPGAYPQIRGR